ncbi:hypothetical protein KA005_59590, partial [bacterium]|nr:hypothetical protein [bacterium]
MGIDITSVLANTYNNWPRIRQAPKRAVLRGVSCARTGPERLVGPFQKILAEDHMYYNHYAIESAFKKAMNL